MLRDGKFYYTIVSGRVKIYGGYTNTQKGGIMRNNISTTAKTHIETIALLQKA